MNIPAHLAASLLDTDFENICAKLKAGGTLTTAERAMLQKSAANVAAVPPTPSGTPVTVPSAAPLHLTALPSPANGDGSISRDQLEAWSVLYGIQHRQLRRMIARGREKNDPCPLDDPRRMPAWVETHVEKVRAGMWGKVCAAAADVGAEPVDAPGKPDPAPPVAQATAVVSPGMSIDLATVGGVEGESVELFRRLFAAAKQEIEAAYKMGSEEKKRSLHAQLDKLGESLRKHEAAAEAKAKRRGELLSKSEVFTAVAEALNILRLMREHRRKRILSRLPTLDPHVAEQLATALDEVAAREEDVFNHLPLLRNADDLLDKLAA